MRAMRDDDVQWRDGKVFSLVFSAGEEAADLLKEAYTLFFSENGLNPTAFPSLRRFETEVVQMSAALLGGDEAVVGNMTSGGTESILLAVLAAREWARVEKPNVSRPQMVLAESAHPAFDKAGHYFDVDVVRVPLGPDFRADAAAMAAAVTPNTILMVASAPSYPHGLVDPVAEIAAVARRHGILCHVDACVGGFVLPFVRKAGFPVPNFDFRVPGVTSISADLHKYGYAAKGASILLYRRAGLRRHQLFAVTEWPGGIYASPTLLGTRPGGAIAAAWAIMNYLGETGYVEIARQVMATAVRLRDGINRIDGVHVIGNPPATLMAIGAEALDVFEIGDEMTARGWHLDRQQRPATLHLTVNRLHVGQADAFLADLAAAVATVQRPGLRRWGNRVAVRAAETAVRILPQTLVSRLTGRASALFGGDNGLPQRSAAMYGMMGTLPNRGDLKEVILDLVESFTAPADRGKR